MRKPREFFVNCEKKNHNFFLPTQAKNEKFRFSKPLRIVIKFYHQILIFTLNISVSIFENLHSGTF
jgi:hypothetical protein